MKKFLKNTRAATAVEFAFVVPVLLVLLLGIIQFGLTLFFDSSLNTGIRSVAREGIGHGYNGAPAGVTDINKIMNANLGGLYNTSQASIIMMSFDSFDDPAFTQAKNKFMTNSSSLFPTSYGTIVNIPAQSGKIILYGVKYKWGQTFGVKNPFLPSALYSFSIVRNESF